MKALVLAGGEGTRLRPITFTSAKQLVPVANKPILFYGLEAIRDAGISDVGIIVGSTEADIRAAVGDGSALGIRVTYIPQEAPLGLAHAVKIARPFLGDDRFVMYLGDNLLKDGIRDIVEDFRREKPNAQVLLTRVEHPEYFGVAEVEDGRVVRLVEKPKEPKSDLALCGVYLFDRNLFSAIEEIRPSFRNELEITDAIQILIERGLDVRMREVAGWWKDTGQIEDLLEANRLILEEIETRIEGEVDAASEITGRVVIEDGARVISSRIRGPAIVGEGASVENSFIGPFTSIGEECEITDTEIEHSIILKSSRIEGVMRIEDSLLGREVKVKRSLKKPKAHRFMLGDRSELEIVT